MKIQTRFLTSMAVFIIIFFIISLAVVTTMQQAERMNLQRDAALRAVQDTYEIGWISMDYLLKNGDRQRVQWDEKNDSLTANIALVDPGDLEQRVLVDNIRKNQKFLSSIFAEMSSIVEKNNGSSNLLFDDEKFLTSWSRIEIADQRIIFDATRLADMIKEDLEQIRFERTMFIYSLIGLIIIMFVINFLLINKQVHTGVTSLEKGMKIIGSGDLNYRIKEEGDDEFKFLASAFNSMTTRRQEIETELCMQKSMLEVLLNAPEDTITLVDRTGVVLRTNISGAKQFGNMPEELIGQNIYNLLPPETAWTRKNHADLVFKEGKPVMFEDVLSGRYHYNAFYPVFKPDQKTVDYIALFVTDITDQKQVEIELKDKNCELEVAIEEIKSTEDELRHFNDDLERQIAERTEELRKSLQVKEMLLKEIHHRVKNNMQVISSLLLLQSRSARDDETRLLLKESQDRIRSIALVHEQLYRSDNLSQIEYGNYLRKMFGTLFNSYETDPRLVSIVINGENVLISIEQAVPCSLVVNELLSNSLKHAFPDGRKGEIRVDFNLDPTEKMYILDYRDNGVGFPEGFNSQQTETLGMSLIFGLTKQLDGRIVIGEKPGVHFTISFPVKPMRGNHDK